MTRSRQKQNKNEVSESHTTGNNSTRRNVRLNTLEVLTEDCISKTHPRDTSHAGTPDSGERLTGEPQDASPARRAYRAGCRGTLS